MNQLDNQYGTLFEAVEALKKKGYTDELTITEDGLFNNALPLDPSASASIHSTGSRAPVTLRT